MNFWKYYQLHFSRKEVVSNWKLLSPLSFLNNNTIRKPFWKEYKKKSTSFKNTSATLFSLCDVKMKNKIPGKLAWMSWFIVPGWSLSGSFFNQLWCQSDVYGN